jgi:hypothetical protein
MEEEAIAKIKAAKKTGDIELAHKKADEILCDLLATLGYEKVVEEFHAMEKWYA